MSYADAYHIYNEFDVDHSQKGVCLANIGSIMMQLGDYRRAQNYFDRSIENLNNNIVGNEEMAMKAVSIIQ